MKQIRVVVDLPWPGLDNVEEYYDLPGDWNEMTQHRQQMLLEEMGAELLANIGIGYAASVVDVDDAPAPHDPADCGPIVGSDNPEGWEDSWDRERAAEHDPRNCGTCDDHADTQRDADRAEQQLDGAQ